MRYIYIHYVPLPVIYKYMACAVYSVPVARHLLYVIGKPYITSRLVSFVIAVSIYRPIVIYYIQDVSTHLRPRSPNKHSRRTRKKINTN